MALVTGSSTPKMASSGPGISRKSRPTPTATPNAMRELTPTAAQARSGLPAPRFWPTTAAVAPITPTDVKVISENSSV